MKDIDNDKVFNAISINENLLCVLLNLMESKHREHCNYIAQRLSDSILDFVEDEIGAEINEMQETALESLIADKLPEAVEGLYHILIHGKYRDKKW